MKYLFLSLLILSSCGELAIKGEPGSPGKDGTNGVDGKDGPRGRDGVQGPQGEAGPVGERGPTGSQGEAGPTGPKGDTGEVGPAGQDGEEGPQGPPGTSGTSITFVTPCADIPTAARSFPEILMCVDSKLYGVYAVASSGKIHWTYLPPATYRTTDGRNCTFTIVEGCTIQ